MRHPDQQLFPMTILMFIAFSSCHVKPVAMNSNAGKGAVRQIRAIVDASKDGGAWWFPQAPPSFDAQKPHQGKAAADAMRAKGWDVVELPRGEVITPERLNGFGYANYLEGYILFAGTALGINDQGSALRGKLLTFLEQHSSSDLKQSSPAPP